MKHTFPRFHIPPEHRMKYAGIITLFVITLLLLVISSLGTWVHVTTHIDYTFGNFTEGSMDMVGNSYFKLWGETATSRPADNDSQLERGTYTYGFDYEFFPIVVFHITFILMIVSISLFAVAFIVLFLSSQNNTLLWKKIMMISILLVFITALLFMWAFPYAIEEENQDYRLIVKEEQGYFLWKHVEYETPDVAIAQETSRAGWGWYVALAAAIMGSMTLYFLRRYGTGEDAPHTLS